MNRSSLKAAAAAAALSIGAAHAASASYVLDTSLAPGFSSGVDYGDIALTQDGANVDIDVLLSPGFDFVKTGNHTAFTFDIAGAAGYTVTNIISNKYGWIVGASNPALGSFTDGLACAKCAKGGKGAFTDELQFTVTGVSLADFVENARGYSFSADVINLATGNTGAVAAGAPVTPAATSVAEPTSFSLMLAALAGIGFVARRRRHD